MSLIATEAPPFQPLESGEYIAVCVSVIDLGWQLSSFNPDKPKPRLALEFELCGEIFNSGEPRKLLAEYTLTLHKQGSLRPFLEGWLARPLPSNAKGLPVFDTSTLLGKPARLVITQEPRQNNGGMKNVIKAAMPLPKGRKVPEPISPLLLFDLDKPDVSVLQQLPPFLQERIGKAVKPKEVTTSDQGTPPIDGPDFNDSINF